MYRLFSAENSVFSAKVRAYLRFKHGQSDLGSGYEDILVTPELIAKLLIPRSGSPALPQIETPDGDWLQDSSEIIDHCERSHRQIAVIPDAIERPKQRLASYLVELLSDEWLIVPACWERWFFSEDGREPSHRAFNEQQWGAIFGAGKDGLARRAAGAKFFESAFGISEAKTQPRGPYAGLIHLGCTPATQPAWQKSLQRILQALEIHFGQHDYLLGGRPSLADYSLLGPLYAHFYRDPVPGFALRCFYPLICEWVERTNAEGCLNARRYGQKLYSVGSDGSLMGREAMSDGGDWLADDEVPETLDPIFEIFFDEMWPFLCASTDAFKAFLEGEDHKVGGELPRKTFTASPGFEHFQTGEGALTAPFEIGGIQARRMVVPNQIWMLQRIEGAMRGAPRQTLEPWLARFPAASEWLSLGDRLKGCAIRKQGGQFFSDFDPQAISASKT
ncbi:MAG: glutathione S-transferase family protein [Myxococcota bacterium]|nr:glutathione S-transferase family protein [Myxococcota bacterium]